MATTRSLSGSADRTRQGLNIRTYRQLFGTCLRQVSMGDPTVIRASGTLPPTLGEYGSIRIIAYDDALAGNAVERLDKAPGYQVFINHEWEEETYGQTDTNSAFNRGTMFFEKNPPVLTGSITPMLSLTTPPNTGTLPLSLRFKTIQSLGQLDGVLEAFPIRQKVDFTFRNLPPSFPYGELKAVDFYGVKVNIGSRDTLGDFGTGGGLFAQYDTMNAPSILPYDDTLAISSSMIQSNETITTMLRYNLLPLTASGRPAVATVGLPFVDTDLESDSRYDFVYSRIGFEPTFLNSPDIKSAVFAMTASTIEDFDGIPSKSTSTKAGFIYATPNIVGPKMGTDSLAFGGLKK